MLPAHIDPKPKSMYDHQRHKSSEVHKWLGHDESPLQYEVLA